MSGLAFLGLMMLFVMLGAIFIGFPISFTLLFLALTFGYFGLGQVVFDLAYFQTIGMMKEELLAAVPLFIFMGFLTEQAGLMERLFSAFRMLLAPIRGALFAVVILTATVFAMATGIVGAAVTVLGIMAGPIMIKTGYDAKLSAGCITAGGTLGILIPPSVMLIVMGPVIGVSVAELYSAAFGPGFLLAGIYLVYLIIRSNLNPKLGPPVPMEDRVSSPLQLVTELVVGVVPLLLLIAAVLGSMLGGLATPTEASAHRRAGRGVADDRLRQILLGGAEARRAEHHRDFEHGAAAGGDLEHLRRGVRAPGHRELDHRDHARAAVPAGDHAAAGAGPHLPARLAVRVARGDSRLPADLLPGDGGPQAHAGAGTRHRARHADGLVRRHGGGRACRLHTCRRRWR